MTAPTLVFFGDSLTDNGNLYALGADVLEPETLEDIAGPTGAVSDGPTWAASAAGLLGADAANYAYAAARAIGEQTLEDLVVAGGYEDDLLVPIDDPVLDTDINLGQQIDNFTADWGAEDLSNTQAVIFIGGNDLRSIDLSSPTPIRDALDVIGGVMDATATAVQDLADLGVGTIWVADQPAADFYAASADLTPRELDLAQQALELYGTALGDMVAAFEEQGVTVQIVEISGITAAIAEDPTGFGLLAPYDQTLEGSDVAEEYDADQVAFYDEIHPSEATHGIIGAFTAATLDGAETAFGTEASDEMTLSDGGIGFGMEGNDVLKVCDGILFGGSGHDLLLGAQGNEMLSGGSGSDVLYGFGGDDVLCGGIGDDFIAGMRGDDVLIDSLGSDALLGGPGDDIFIFTEAALLGGTEVERNLFLGGPGEDALFLVLSPETAADIAAALGTPAESRALADIGVHTAGIEDIVILEGRESLDQFAEADWYQEADLWGLI